MEALLELDIASLFPDPANARKHGEKNLDAIKGSLARFGQQKPIVVSRENVVVAGNGTLAAAKALGWAKIKAVRSDLTGSQLTAYGIADNRSGELAEWDLDHLGPLLSALKAEDFDLGEIGFDEIDLAKLLPEPIGTVGNTDPDDIPADVETRCKPGDLWTLGDHRLLCGDSTDVLQVERLMGGEKADFAYCDPPYGMFLETNYDAMFATDVAHRKTGQRFEQVKGDHADFAPDLINIVLAAFPQARETFLWGADYYSELLPDRKEGSWIVWDKRCTEEMDRVAGNTFELCWSKAKHKRLIARLQWSGHHGMQRDDAKTRLHPTQKPVALATWFFERWGKFDDKVVDLFLGSGSTLIACEKTGRRCFGMEIDPRYGDVILTRWEKFTGKQAILSVKV